MFKETQLVVATHNSHKTDEIRQIIGSYFKQIVDLTSFPDIAPAIEDGSTFEENSAIKAFAASASLPESLVLADDSGLEVDALDGAPGIYSARYSGDDASDLSNRKKLLHDLSKTKAKGKQRSARFRCVLTLVKGDQENAVFSGTCEGIITNEEKGEGGFGYDPLFIPHGFCETFAQLPAETKNQLSHRGNALASFLDWLRADSRQPRRVV